MSRSRISSKLPAGTPPRIVLAVAHPWLRDTLELFLRSTTVDIVSAATPEALLLHLSPKPEVLIIDVFGFDAAGLELLAQVRRRARSLPVIALLPLDSQDYRDAVIHAGANAVVIEEYADAQLLSSLADVLRGGRFSQYIHKLLMQTTDSNTDLEKGELTMSHSLKETLNRPVSRRSFLKGSATVAGAAAAAKLAHEHRVLYALQEGGAEQAAPGQTVVFDGACRPNCWQSCHLHISVRDGHVVKTTMAPMPNPRYNRVCLRGLSQVQRINHPDRLKYPMRRVGDRGSGQWERISWDEAIQAISSKFKEIREQYGNQAVAFFPIFGNYGYLNGFMGGITRFANVTGSTQVGGSIDTALPLGLNRVLGSLLWYNGNETLDLENARTIIVWGCNLAEAQIHNWHFVADALDNGAKLVVVDPTFTSTAAKAHLWISPRPGSDIALALSMMNVIIEENLTDVSFLREHTVAPFLVRADTQRFLRESDVVEGGSEEVFMVWDAEAEEARPVADVTEPPLEGKFKVNDIQVSTAFQLLKDLVAQYAPEEAEKITEVKPDVVRELARLYATNSPSTIYPGYGLDRWYNAHTAGHALATLASLTGNVGKPGATPAGGEFIPNFWAPINWGGWWSPDGLAGKSLNGLLLYETVKTGELKGEPYPIKALFFANGNPVSNYVEQTTFINEVIPKMDMIVVADMFMTDTAEYADILLPSTHWFEDNDIVGGNHPFMLIQEQAVPPAFECKSDMDIFRLLAKELDAGQYFEQSDEDYMRLILDSDTLRDYGITLETLREQKAIRYIPDPYIPVEGGIANTPSGRLEFFLESPVTNYDYGQDLSQEHNHLPDFRAPIEAWPENPLHEKYPLVCYQEHTRWRVHSTWFNVPWLRELDPEPIIRLSPQDADARGIHTGDYVEVFNDRGHAVVKAVVSNALRAGVVNIPKGWQRSQFKQGGYNELTAAHRNPITMNQAYFDTLVEVRKV